MTPLFHWLAGPRGLTAHWIVAPPNPWASVQKATRLMVAGNGQRSKRAVARHFLLSRIVCRGGFVLETALSVSVIVGNNQRSGALCHVEIAVLSATLNRRFWCRIHVLMWRQLPLRTTLTRYSDYIFINTVQLIWVWHFFRGLYSEMLFPDSRGEYQLMSFGGRKGMWKGGRGGNNKRERKRGN